MKSVWALGLFVALAASADEPKAKAPAMGPVESATQKKAAELISDKFAEYDKTAKAVKELKAIPFAEAEKLDDEKLAETLATHEKTLKAHHDAIDGTSLGPKLLKAITTLEHDDAKMTDAEKTKLRSVKIWLLRLLASLEGKRIEDKEQKTWFDEAKGALVEDDALPKDAKERKKKLEESQGAESGLVNFFNEQFKKREEAGEKLYDEKAGSYHVLVEVQAAKQVQGPLAKLSDDEKAFLKKIGYDEKNPPEVKARADLSDAFGDVKMQGDTKACAAYAITSDLGYVAKADISPHFAYFLYLGGPGKKIIKPRTEIEQALVLLLAKNPEDAPKNVILWKNDVPDNYFDYFAGSLKVKDEAPLFKKLDVGASHTQALEFFKTNPLVEEEDYPSNKGFVIPEALTKVMGRKHLVESWEGIPKGDGAEEKYTLSGVLLRTMVAMKQPPIVSIATDARSISGNWLRPEPPVGSIGHILNVVGYGTGLDPFDGRRKAYFLVRDSLVKQPMHYRIAETELLAVLGGAYKITKAKTTDKAPEYKALEAEVQF